tara:strand:+ start:20 stop:208 length:189 start_codon:yes stop_codon:yes gene_type:complete
MITRQQVFNARNHAELLEMLRSYLGRTPTSTEYRTWVNSVFGPAWAIPAWVSEQTRKANKPS